MSQHAHRRRDLLLTAVMLGILLTPGWLLPAGWTWAWQLGVLLLAGPLLYLSWTHAPWHPTPHAELDRIVAALDLSKGDRFCDLGAGDGRMVKWVHERTGADCTGIEAAPLAWLLAQLRLFRTEGARVVFGDLYAADLSEYDAVYVWGTAYSVGTEDFAAFVRSSMSPGSRLVSYHQPVPGLEPTAVNEGGQRPLFVYTLDTRCRGTR